jgi:chorismate synthase
MRERVEHHIDGEGISSRRELSEDETGEMHRLMGRMCKEGDSLGSAVATSRRGAPPYLGDPEDNRRRDRVDVAEAG